MMYVKAFIHIFIFFTVRFAVYSRHAPMPSALTPFPVVDFWHVLTMLIEVLLVLDKLVLNHLF
jgi:hypothetical protein